MQAPPNGFPRHGPRLLWSLTLLTSLAWTAFGGSPALLVLFATCTTVAALARVAPALLAAVLGPTILLTVHLLSSLAWHPLGIPLRWGHLVLLVAAALIAGLALLRLPRTYPLRDLGNRDLAVAALVWPVLVVVSLGLVNLFSETKRLGWLMVNDAAMTLLQARQYVNDSPATADYPSNPVPGTSHVLALFLVPGRGDVEPREWIVHDLWRAQQPIILGLVAVGVLTALATAAAVPARHRRVRVAVALVAGLLPWTWFVSGFAWQFGFWNVPLTAAALMVPWVAFLHVRRASTLTSATLTLSAVPVASLWSPLLLVPGLLAVAVVVGTWRDHLALRGVRLIGWVLSLAVLAAYLAVVTLPAYSEHSDGLRQEGAIFPLSQGGMLSVVAISLGIAVMVWASVGDRWPVVGAAAIALAAVVGTQVLLHHRRDHPLSSWGYYPIKYAWLCVIVLVAVGMYAAVRLVVGGDRRGRGLPLLPLAVVCVMGASVLQALPHDLRPANAYYPTPKAAPDWRLRSVLPILSVLRRDGISEYDDAIVTMSRLADPRHTVYFTRYHRVDWGRDLYMNFLLFQMSWLRGDQEFRAWSYTLPDSTETVCDMLRDAREHVEVVTSVPGWGEEIRAECPREEFELTLLPVPDERPLPET